MKRFCVKNTLRWLKIYVSSNYNSIIIINNTENQRSFHSLFFKKHLFPSI